jgi:hypothetical protein
VSPKPVPTKGKSLDPEAAMDAAEKAVFQQTEIPC